ncbi:MAG: hypothetical protein WDN10_03300 [bacterium]
MRRVLIILAILIVLGGLGAAAYFFIFAGTPTLVVDTGTNPFGNPAGDAAGGESDTVDPDTGGAAAGTVVTQRLIEITKGPVVPGAVAFISSSTAPLPAGEASGTSTVSLPVPDTEVRYALRESGNLFSYLFHARAAKRLVNKTIPGTQEATWLPDGSLAYLRYAGGTAENPEIDTYALPADGTEGFFLPVNIAGIATVGSSSVFSLSSGGNGSIGTVSKADGSASRTAFSSPLGSLSARPAGSGQFVAYTKATGLSGGYAFLIDTAGAMNRLFGPVPGLVALPSPLGTWALLSYTEQGNLKTSLLNIRTRELIALPVATIADKCAWTSDESAVYCGVPVPGSLATATYPDDWYQGAVSFTDRIWKIDVGGRFAELALDFSGATDGPLDATALTVDPRKDVLVFLNKRDGSLWAYDL